MHVINESNISGEVNFNDTRTGGLLYFNKNNFASDTKGALKGAVYYVQNSIIPSHKHISDDIQPRIIENRDLMILFSPDIDGLDIIYLNVRDENDRIVLTRTLVNDESRIPLCQQLSLIGNPDFLNPGNFDITIDQNDMIQKISNDIDYFEQVISDNPRIKIRTSDGNYARTFTLRKNRNLSGRVMLFVCDSGYTFEVIRPGIGTITMSRGDSYFFVNHNGDWFTEKEMQYSSIRYMKNCWHTLVLAAAVKPGIKFEFFTHDKKGIIDDVDVGSPNKLLLHTISIGMLVPYLKNFEFQSNPEYHRQYFQQIPISQLIVSTYDPIYLEEIMLPDGEFIIDSARDEGGGHVGSLREFIAKDLISQGINYANYGYTSSKLQDANRTMAVGQICVHISVGKYINGVQTHGQSGGAGLATLGNTIGNEFSHELGHNYGLGHYPGGFYGSVAQIPSVRNSTWGWDKDNHFFIPNFEPIITNKPTYLGETTGETQFAAPFEGHSLGKDAMAGGGPLYPEVNAFTLHTPYVLSDIQKFFESKAMFNPASPTGFSIWNMQTKKIEPYRLVNTEIVFTQLTVRNGVNITADELNGYLKNKTNVLIITGDGAHARYVYLPDADQSNNGTIVKFEINSSFYVNVEVNGEIDELHKGTIRSYISNGSVWEVTDYEITSMAPYKQGVKVITVVGYYDPEEKLTSYIYPALNGSYGNVYHYPERSQCYLEVKCSSGQNFYYPLATSRFISDRMNKFHVNIERDLIPDEARLYINDRVIFKRVITLGSDNLSYTVNGAPL
ncbi:M66 family metalloprotease [Klebsiella sp. BIGb0407]|uniref:M66 family metalloprotease n=1 Tax=Klebsiella sp. BIGb0407 TaxID=2940603 RepID=UPI0021687924|nr:M66 family metalloprotease [Klebsiella sp. BIGb0407]MCS3431163.1 hypothetical protein [Klebsiella sp. BIGb0407]